MKQLERLKVMQPSSAEYTVTRTYLEWLVELPWSVSTEDKLDIQEARNILNTDHYDLEKVKKRILEYLAVRKLKSDKTGPTPRLVGRRRACRGGPAAALPEVRDPEQTHTFSDHYLEVPFDLSKVMFVATANIMDPVPPALRDRLEGLERPGYTREEKLNISRQFLIPKQLEEHGLSKEKVVFEEPAVAEVIDSYTREAGGRNLEREMASVIRAVAVLVAENKAADVERITVERIAEFLGPAKHLSEVADRTAEPGGATG